MYNIYITKKTFTIFIQCNISKMKGSKRIEFWNITVNKNNSYTLTFTVKDFKVTYIYTYIYTYRYISVYLSIYLYIHIYMYIDIRGYR